ncbi:HAD-like domain [Phaffia rhodozyma]|uniref:HAD-like domain n=1 Tax=Phaffia rhodozyma TaxID=264483 RepID=A0A0F7SWF8_PHARH|nr:HAD-like domain [Phaffia rhodozyma]
MSFVIAVDFDDVLCQTNLKVAELHNAQYETDMTIDDFRYYHYWRNRGWGNPEETLRKVRLMFAQGVYRDPLPIADAFSALEAIKAIPGAELVIVTARSENSREESQAYLDKHFPGIFSKIYFTGAFTHTEAEGETGPVVLTLINASVLIDDAIENALDTASETSIPVLLYGDYPWNLRSSSTGKDEREHMSYNEVRERGLEHLEDEEDLIKDLPATVRRVSNWEAVVQWVKENLKGQ